jgi:hypothetical protein
MRLATCWAALSQTHLRLVFFKRIFMPTGKFGDKAQSWRIANVGFGSVCAKAPSWCPGAKLVSTLVLKTSPLVTLV